MDDFRSYFEDVPDALPFYTDFEEPNTDVIFYEGEYRIKAGEEYLDVKGRLLLSWSPDPRAKFIGVIKTGGLKTANALLATPLEILVDNVIVGKGLMMESSIPSKGRLSLSGLFSGKILFGAETRKVTRVAFSLPNHYEYRGENVKTTSSMGNYRFKLEADDHEIIIDKHEKYRERVKKLKAQGGYIVLCTGEMNFKKAKSSKQVTELCYSLGYFLSFLNGRRVTPIFIFGLKDKEILWRHYGNFNPAPFQSVENWGPRISYLELNTAWANFLKLWSVPDNRSFLTYLIRWYVEANTNSGFPEGALIMAQTALELIFNWWIVENKKIILGNDAKNMSAENKIRLILSNCNVNAELPSYILADFKRLNYREEHIDGPHFIVSLRNAVVHSNQSKRKKVFELPSNIIFYALQLSLWYVEMGLLKILEYAGKYYDRNHSIRYHGSAHEHYVPWAVLAASSTKKNGSD